MKVEDVEIGNRLRKARLAAGLTIEQVSSLLLNQSEAGVRRASDLELELFARLYEVKLIGKYTVDDVEKEWKEQLDKLTLKARLQAAEIIAMSRTE